MSQKESRISNEMKETLITFWLVSMSFDKKEIRETAIIDLASSLLDFYEDEKLEENLKKYHLLNSQISFINEKLKSNLVIAEKRMELILLRNEKIAEKNFIFSKIRGNISWFFEKEDILQKPITASRLMMTKSVIQWLNESSDKNEDLGLEEVEE